MKTILLIIAALVLIAGGWYYSTRQSATNAAPSQVQPIAIIGYQCNGGKTIHAEFYEGTTTPAAGPDQPPTPGGSAKLTLSDGRAMTLKQTISADGVRYSNGDPMVKGSETFVFWTKGNGVLVLENDVEKSYTGCVVQSE
jgi:hypothetical protein